MSQGPLHVSIDQALEHAESREDDLRGFESAVHRANSGLKSLQDSLSMPAKTAAVRDGERALLESLKVGLRSLTDAAPGHPLLSFTGTEEYDRKVRACEFKIRNRR